MTSRSIFAWMKCPSWFLRTVPFIPIKQCSFVFCRIAFWSWCCVLPGFLTFVLIHTISSHLLYPHFFRHSLPRSSPSPEPHHTKTKDLWAATSSIFRFMMSSQSHGVHVNVIPLALRWYSSRGGVMWMTSNFVPRERRSKGLISHLRYIGWVALDLICASWGKKNVCVCVCVRKWSPQRCLAMPLPTESEYTAYYVSIQLKVYLLEVATPTWTTQSAYTCLGGLAFMHSCVCVEWAFKQAQQTDLESNELS